MDVKLLQTLPLDDILRELLRGGEHGIANDSFRIDIHHHGGSDSCRCNISREVYTALCYRVGIDPKRPDHFIEKFYGLEA